MEETAASIFRTKMRRVKTLMDYMGSVACLKAKRKNWKIRIL
jgi:hypothetical protein